MAKYENFYETVKESLIRLRNTIILYDGEPMVVHAITNHKKDGIFRIYMEQIVRERGKPRPSFHEGIDSHNPEHAELGNWLDKWMEANKSGTLIRKQMNSPLFNKFRPFSLGMCNVGNGVIFCERQPVRPKTEQGLTQAAVSGTHISLDNKGLGKGQAPGRVQVDLYTPAFRACIMGSHPSASECLAALLSGEYQNEALAFHREFALVLGPVGLVFLAYRGDIIGVLPKGDFSYVRLDPRFTHAKEVVQGLSLFANFI